MSEIDLKKVVREALIEARVRKYKGLSEIHTVDEEEKTSADRPGAKDIDRVFSRSGEEKKSSAVDDIFGDDEESDVFSSEEPPQKSRSKSLGGRESEGHQAALKMNTIWTNNLSQLMNFGKGKQLVQLMTQRLQNQTGLPAQQMMPIVNAVMQATLEQLDDEVSNQIQEEMPGLLDITRG